MTSLSTRRAGARNGARLAEYAIAEAKREIAAVAAANHAASTARAAAAEKRDADLAAAVTDEQYRAAVVVRDRFGWHQVVRVNAKSVTVATAYSWTDRIPRRRVLEVRTT